MSLSDSSSEYSCIICFESDGDIIDNFFCDCNFKFHSKCYSDWLKKKENKSCMICNSDASKILISEFLLNFDNNNKIDLSFNEQDENIRNNNQLTRIDENTYVSMDESNTYNCKKLIRILVFILIILLFVSFFVLIILTNLINS
jgi:hypothetical protein